MAMALPIPGSKRHTKPESPALPQTPAPRDPLHEAKRIAAAATAEAEEAAQGRALVEARIVVVRRGLDQAQAEVADHSAECARLTTALDDATTLEELGLPAPATEADRQRLQALDARISALTALAAQHTAILEELEKRRAALLSQEQAARTRAAEAPVAALRAAKARHVLAIKRARLAYLEALREAGRFNGEHDLPRPDDAPHPATWVGAIDRHADNLHFASSFEDHLLHRTNRLDAMPTDWLDKLAADLEREREADHAL